MNEKILIVEDDKNIFKLLKYNLEKSGFKCVVSITGEDALEVLDKEAVGLIILDIMLPKMDGFEVCRLIKQEKTLSQIPIIMLTAKGEEIDRVVGLELGADDYVVKPFSIRELLLRIKSVLKRKNTLVETREIFTAGDIILDTARRKVLVGRKNIRLTNMEFELLAILLRRRGRVQTRTVLLDEVWGLTADVTTRTVDTHIKRVRQKLGKAGKCIDTVRGIGYRFKEEE